MTKISDETLQVADQVYTDFSKRVEAGRKLMGRPLTYAEKVLFAHLRELPAAPPKRGETYAFFNPDRVAMQDATAQMALLQFMLSGRDRVAVPTTVHCDHLIRARDGADPDLEEALRKNDEVYAFLKSISAQYGIGFWKPGSGIIHQIILENYAFPGGMMIGTDSHTPNAGGLGMAAIGVGGADAVDVMAGMEWELLWPRLIGVHLKGKLRGWASPKDVILKLLGILTVKGGTGHIVEYFGEGVSALSCTGKATITNMGAELGATCSIFPYDERMRSYLRATGREAVAEAADLMAEHLRADDEVLQNPSAYYDQVIEIDLDELEPMLAGPFTPDRVRPISVFFEEAEREGWDTTLRVGLIGSCTNSSYEDLSRVASLIRAAKANDVPVRSRLYISPGSTRVRDTIERDGMLDELRSIGAIVLANACGPCIGQWDRTDFTDEKPNCIITSFNRNFRGRADGNPETLAFIGSPELVAYLALSGDLAKGPGVAKLTNSKGEAVDLPVPTGEELPPDGFVDSAWGYEPPTDKETHIEIKVSPDSERLQLLTPFAPWTPDDFKDLYLLAKVKGKCTTDHISPAGSWLRYRGHLENISNNMLLGATNAFTGEAGRGKNPITGEEHCTFAQIARSIKEHGKGWIIVADENYGEGSSREHAAMEPRYLGCRAVIARSFARIHETNLKKQGILPLYFHNPDDYERVQEADRIDICGVEELAPGSPVKAVLRHADGGREELSLHHTLSQQQIEWFRAGSALNAIRNQLNQA
ncbi:MAG: aconitate hydratase [Lentisphaerae bacterium]|nr:MAG: aconitate hydratase [Lentisphaerota bacterium]